MVSGSFRALVLLGSVATALGATYRVSDTVIGSQFNNFFAYDNIPDPTHGRVVYVDQGTAQRLNLTYSSSNSFVLRTDYTTTLNSWDAGRNSIRLRSRKQYTTSVQVFDMRHMPQGCGTWPAVWSFGNNWPNDGEIDVLEGVNDQGANKAALHTTPGCTMGNRAQTGYVSENNCDVYATGNAGCGVVSSDARSYGPTFNRNGGGWFAVERSNSGIRVWFWSRNGGGAPSEVTSGSGTVNPDGWGTPFANFPNTQCDIASKFGSHSIIINLTLCGDWAGQQPLYSGAGCPGVCNDYVNANPRAFSEAYFDFASIRVYQP